jgi:nickel-dependent lactate racemase
MYSIRNAGSVVVYRDAAAGEEIRVPADQCLGLVTLREPPPVAWPDDVRASLAAPLDSPRLRDRARGAKRVAIVVSDSTRGVPTSRILPLVVAELASGGVPPSSITVVVATGVHRPATRAELEEIVGATALAELAVVNHEPDDPRRLVALGETSFGTPVEVNRTVYESDLRIAIGKVEPHEFAGFSGGRKSILPGIASRRTIERNHRPEMLLAPGARPGQLEGNPVHEDMVEAAARLRLHFMVNVVLNQAGEAVGVFAGDPGASHRAAVELLGSFCRVRLQERPDVAVTTPGRPLDIDFYQSIKPLISLAPVMGPGGVLVLYSACRDGLGTTDMLLPYEGATDVAEVMARLRADYRIQMDHALLLGKILQRGIRIVVASPRVDPAVLRRLFLTPAATPQQALEIALRLVPKRRPTVLFLPQAQRTLPTLDAPSHAN